MKRFAALFLAAFIILPVSLSAQVLTNKERRNINLKVLNVIEEYERTASLSDSEEIYSFISLFTSQDALVYCDIMGAPNYLSKVGVKEYIKEAEERARGNIEMEILNVRKGEIIYSDGCWLIPILFSKSLSYWDNNGVLFSAKEFYGNENYHITLNLRYNPEDETCLIESIEGRLNSNKSFPKGKFQVVTRNEDLIGRDLEQAENILYNGRKLEYNSFNQAIVSADFAPEVNDPDIEVIPIILNSTDNYDNITYSFKVNKNRAKLRLAAAPIMAYRMSSVSEGLTLERSAAYEAGIDMGTTFVAGKAKVGVYVGAGISFSNARFGLSDTLNYKSQSIWYKNPEDGYFYKSDVNYSLHSATESLSFKDIILPVYAEGEHRIGTSAVFVWNVGAKAYFALDTDAGIYSISGTRTVGGNKTDFTGEQHTVFLNPVYHYSRNFFSLSAFANIGVDINLTANASNLKNRMFATVKVGYEQGLMPVYKTTGSSYTGSGAPVVYDPVNKANIANSSFINNISLNRQAVWLELGVKVKL